MQHPGAIMTSDPICTPAAAPLIEELLDIELPLPTDTLPSSSTFLYTSASDAIPKPQAR